VNSGLVKTGFVAIVNLLQITIIIILWKNVLLKCILCLPIISSA
jgi:hypothetical protein